jgi:hypothetical protein
LLVRERVVKVRFVLDARFGDEWIGGEPLHVDVCGLGSSGTPMTKPLPAGDLVECVRRRQYEQSAGA